MGRRNDNFNFSKSLRNFRNSGWTLINLILIGLIFCASVLAAIASLFVKKGMAKFTFFTLPTNRLLLSGIFLHGAAAIIYILALKGGPLTVVFPLASMSYL